MKVLAILALMAFSAVNLFAQTMLIDPNGDGGFENGITFALNGWTSVNFDNVNKWQVGTALYDGGAGRGAYISNDGGASVAYTSTTSQVSHFYRDVDFPAGETDILLYFVHSSTTLTTSDIMAVYLVSPETVPMVGVEMSEGFLAYAWGVSSSGISKEYRIIIPPSAAGTKKRLVFSWRNGEGGSGSPSAVDNIYLFSRPGITSNGTGGGAWSSSSTWIGGVTPGSADHVVIAPGDEVTVDAVADITAASVSGVLVFDNTTNREFVIAEDLTIANGGMVATGATGSAMHTLKIGGDVANNGTIDLSTSGGQAGADLEFNGSGIQTLFGSGIIDITTFTAKAATTTAQITLEPENLTVQGLNTNAPGFVNLVSGNLELAGDFPLESFVFTVPSPVIATSTALRFDNPNIVVKPQNGSLTVQGRLHVVAGDLNVGEDQDDCIILAPGSTMIVDGGAVGVSGALGVASQAHFVKFAQNGGTISVAKFGNSSPTFPSFSLGSSSNATTTAGIIIIENANTAPTGPGDFGMPLTSTITGGTLQLGVMSTAQSLWRIRGAIPNLVVDQVRGDSVRLTASTKFTAPTTIPQGATLHLNGWGLDLKDDLVIDGFLDAGGIAPGNGGSLTFSGSEPQSFSGIGTIRDNLIDVITINNGSGNISTAVNSSHNIVVGEALNVNAGSFGGSGPITLGNPDASTVFNLRRAGDGMLLNPPVFNLDGVIFNVTYNFSPQPIVAGVELPAAFNTLTINTVNGAIFNATTTAQALALTNGVLTIATSTPLTIAGTDPTAVTFSGNNYINGPVILTLPPLLDGSATYTLPLGTTRQRLVSLVDTKTDAIANPRVFFHPYNPLGSGTPGTGISALTQAERWLVSDLAGEGTVTETRLRVSMEGLGDGHRLAKSSSIDGTYNSVGGTVVGNTIMSDVVSSFSYFAIGLTDTTRSGTFTVGASGDYPTLTAAINDLTPYALSGPVTLSLIDTVYTTPAETFPLVIKQMAGANATNNLTIKPASGVSPTITGAPFISAIFKLQGADYVTIDGSNNGTDSRDMTVLNTYGGGGYVIWLSSSGAGMGAKHNVIKNLNLAAGSDQTSSNAYTGGILVTGDGEFPTPTIDGADSDSNVVQNNYIKKARYGIFLRGAPGNPNDGNSIVSNLIGPPAFGSDIIGKTGIVAQHQSGATISDNEVRFTGLLSTDSYPEVASEDKVGIALGAESWPTVFSSTTVTKAVVTRNIIHDIIEEKTQSAVGILLDVSGGPTNNLVANNVIYNVRSNGTSGNQGVGIAIANGVRDAVVFNSILMEGDIDPNASTTATGSNVGVRITGGSDMTLKNNIVSVDLTSNTGTLNHFAIAGPSFYSWGTGGLDFNNYYIDTSNSQMKLGGIGFSVPYTGYAGLAEWKTTYFGTQDAHSRSFAPDFTSATDLHLNVSSPNTSYAGTPAAGVATDHDGEARSAGFPYIGADEVPAYPLIVPPLAPAPILPADNATGQPTSIVSKWKPSLGAAGYQFQLSLSSLFETTVVSDSSLTDTTIAVPSLANDTEYFWRVLAHNSAGASPYSATFSFTTIPLPPVAPANLTATAGDQQAILRWNRNSESKFMRYRIYRGTSPVPTTLTDSTFGGNDDTAKVIGGLTNGTTYYFRVTAVDSFHAESPYSNEVSATPDVPTDVENILNQIPEHYSLFQNYPNPFNPSTIIRYGLPERSSVTVELFDMLGRRIAVLVKSEQDARYYEIRWDANVPSGIYFCRIHAVASADQSRTFQQIRKMVLLR